MVKTTDQVPDQKPTETVPKAVVTEAAPVRPSGEPRNFLAVIALTVSLGIFGIHKLYLGDKTLGWVRFGIGVGAMLLSWIPFINILASLLLVGLFIWAAIDLFQLYLTRHTDAEGQEFVATLRDRRYAKGLFIYAIVSYSLAVLATIAIVLMIALMGVGAFSQGMDEYQRDGGTHYRYDTYDN